MIRPLPKVHWKAALDLVTSLTMIAAAIFLVGKSQFGSSAQSARPKLLIPTDPVPIANATLEGSSDAKAALIIYSDFQCPFCKRFAHETLPAVTKDYVSNGKLLLVFRHFPLTIHERAKAAAVAVECAGRQGRFWEMHDRLFEATSLGDADLRALAMSLGLIANEFDACVRDPDISARINRDIALGRGLGVNSTPTFFLGTKLANGTVKITKAISGAKPMSDFRKDIDSLLN